MRISHMAVNHLYNPAGYDLSNMTFTWKVENSQAAYSKAVRLEISEKEDMDGLVYDTGVLDNCRQCSQEVSMELKSRTRYFWRVWVQDEKGTEVRSDVAWFETGKLKEAWRGNWIGTEKEEERMPFFFKEFTVEKKISKARLYIYGAGLYEAYLNGDKVGNEFLQPGYHSYDLLMEYQTYDVIEHIKAGKNHIAVLLGEGWYKGRFGFDGDYKNLYGNYKKCIAELIITYEDDSEKWIVTDSSWEAAESPVGNNGIYDGEWIDDTAEYKKIPVKEFADSKELLTERSNPPVCKTKCFVPVSQKVHSEGYLLLDFGESITGWVEWEGKLEYGQKIKLSYGEVLQNDTFYNENLRTAKAEFVYVSNGEEKTVRPHFTYYGFRYVKAEGLKKGQQLLFKAYRLMSDIPVTGKLLTSNEKVNCLIANTLRSQQCNFLDIPTDCPQRDERMGWTGDAAIFAGTACFHMDCSAFFRHYLRSLYREQRLLGGAVPFFVPRPKMKPGKDVNPFYITAGACVWGDAATIIPWTLYEYYGDKGMLREQYPSMCAWTDYVTGRTAENETAYLWQNDRQLGDWLALDNGDRNNPVGKTDVQMLASAYYYQSTYLCFKAAQELSDKRQEEYGNLAHNIRQAFIKYYFDEKLRLRIEPTQTACALLLDLKLYPDGGNIYLAQQLQKLIEKNKGHLDTGFVGTPVLCQALSENGYNDRSYELLLNEDYPGWLHEVKLGATTVWERWNSLNEDGSIGDTGMNSLNHYAYGSIANWIYRYMCGFRPQMNKDIKMIIKPMPNEKIRVVKGAWESPYGTYVSEWNIDEKRGISYKIEIPFNANAMVILPGGKKYLLEKGSYCFNERGEHE